MPVHESHILQPDRNRIGYIGLGNMGGAIAERLIERGWQLELFARREASLAPFRNTTARIHHSTAALAQNSDILGICVGDSRQINEVLFGEGAAAANLRPGNIVIIQSTIEPSECKSFEERLAPLGVHLVDAPVTGGSSRARLGTLTIPCGGDETTVKRCMPLLRCEATTVVHVGEAGAGQLLKLINNMTLVANFGVALEATRIAKKMGLDRESTWKVLIEGSGESTALAILAKNITEFGEMFPGQISYPGGAVGLLAKDVSLFLHELDQVSPPETVIAESLKFIMQMIKNANDGPVEQ